MGYGIMTTDTAREMGHFRTERAALRWVLDVVERYGADSPEALTLALARTHGDAATASIAHGAELVKRALALRGGGHRAVPGRRKRAAA